MARLNRIWRCNTISFASKFKLYKSLVTSSMADSEKKRKKDPGFRNQVPEETSLHILLGAKDQQPGSTSKINFLVGPQPPLLATVKRWKLAWFGHVTRHDSLSKYILQNTLEGGRHRGQQRKCWTDNIKGGHPAHTRTPHKGLLQLSRLMSPGHK